MLHTSSGGEKEINLPGRYTVYEMLSGSRVGGNIREFREEVSQGATRIYEFQEH